VKQRAGLAVLLALGCLGSSDPSGPPAPKLLVYLQTPVTASSLQKSLSKELPGVDVLVLSRFKDFERAMTDDRPDAVIALRPVLDEQNLEPGLVGVRDDREAERYVVMTLEERGATDQLGDKTLGAVDLLGRKRMSSFVGKLLRTPTPPKINPVIKEEDLLPLLQFKAADAILVPERIATEFRKTSELKLRIAEGPWLEVGLPCATFLTDAGRVHIRRSMQGMTAEARKQLGVEAWK
jgi:hypothetical protein